MDVAGSLSEIPGLGTLKYFSRSCGKPRDHFVNPTVTLTWNYSFDFIVMKLL